MSEYTVVLTDEQDLALAYETERKATMPLPTGPGMPQLPPQTPADVLQQLAAQHMDMLYMQVQNVVEPLLSMATSMAPEHRAALLAAVPRTSIMRYLTLRLQEEGR